MGVAALAATAIASVGIAAYSAASESKASKTQSILDEAAIGLNSQQAKTQAEQAALAHARSFRQALASQVSIAGFRGGSGSIVRQFGAESISNFLADQRSIQAGISLADIQVLNQRAQVSANRTAANIGAGTRFANATLNAINVGINLNSISKGGASTKGATDG